MDFSPQQNLFILVFPYKLRAFAKGLSVRELRTPDGATPEGTRVGARRGIWILRHGFGHGFPRKTARILFPKLAWTWRGFPAPNNPRQIHATQNPNVHTIFGSFLPNGFSGCSIRCAALFVMPVFLCRSNKTCKRPISFLGTSSGTIQRASIQ